jgi:hypothetical protein
LSCSFFKSFSTNCTEHYAIAVPTYDFGKSALRENTRSYRHTPDSNYSSSWERGGLDTQGDRLLIDMNRFACVNPDEAKFHSTDNPFLHLGKEKCSRLPLRPLHHIFVMAHKAWKASINISLNFCWSFRLTRNTLVLFLESFRFSRLTRTNWLSGSFGGRSTQTRLCRSRGLNAGRIVSQL